jgi:hypothetical protein
MKGLLKGGVTVPRDLKLATACTIADFEIEDLVSRAREHGVETELRDGMLILKGLTEEQIKQAWGYLHAEGVITYEVKDSE